MKIIKLVPRKMPAEKEYQFKCGLCGSTFQALEYELDIWYDVDGTKMCRFHCPACGFFTSAKDISEVKPNLEITEGA